MARFIQLTGTDKQIERARKLRQNIATGGLVQFLKGYTVMIPSLEKRITETFIDAMNRYPDANWWTTNRNLYESLKSDVLKTLDPRDTPQAQLRRLKRGAK